jgi:hypothetical protein
MEDFDYTDCPPNCPALDLFGDAWMCCLGHSSHEDECCVNAIKNRMVK